MKGVGDSGTVSAPPAVASAILDALRPEGFEDLELPMTADRIWHAVHCQRDG
jgi:carbon-monoxide dehydrogenase large subunit